jgi:hypothetical protein
LIKLFKNLWGRLFKSKSILTKDIPIRKRIPKFEVKFFNVSCRLVLTYEDGFVDEYVGKGLTWHTFPHMKRCNKDTCEFLKVVYEYAISRHNSYIK